VRERFCRRPKGKTASPPEAKKRFKGERSHKKGEKSDTEGSDLGFKKKILRGGKKKKIGFRGGSAPKRSWNERNLYQDLGQELSANLGDE